MIATPFPAFYDSYVEDSGDWVHGESLLDINHEETDVLLVRLEKVDRVYALNYQNLCVFIGKELDIFAIVNGDVIELEGSI